MKIVDLSTDIAGQWASKLFAMDCAQVLRPVGIDDRPARLAAYLDAGKRCVPWHGSETLDGAVLVFTTFDAGAMTGFANNLAIPDDCVQVTTSTYGMTGPYAGLRGGPLAAWAAGGYLAITGKPEREPLMGPENLCGYVAGYTAAAAAEAALRRRAATGSGEHVDIAAMEAMLPAHQTTFSNLAFGNPRRRTGRFYEVHPMGGLQCRDGHVVVCTVTDEEFDRFAAAIDVPELLTDERYLSGMSRLEHRQAFDAAIAPFLLSKDADEIVSILSHAGVTAAKVALAEDVRANPQLAYRGFWRPGGAPGNPVPQPVTFAAQPGMVAMPRARSSFARRASKGLPLDGIVVADFTVFWAGPSATRTLADLGARTVWVERPGSRAAVDLERDPAAANPALLFAAELGRNKESVVLDLQSGEGLAAARALIARCDVVVENNRPGVMDKVGLGARDMCARHPDLVYVSLPGFGSTGPWAQRRSYGPVIEAASGIVGRTGYQGDEPLRLGHPLPDAVGGLVGALTALRGLRRRDATGQGGWYDVSQLEAYVAICGEELIGDDPLPRIGNASRAGATIILLPCLGEDEWLAVRLVSQEERARFHREMGSPDNEADAHAASRGVEKFALMERLQGAGLEAFPVMKPEDLVRDPSLWARSRLIEFPFAERMAILAGSPYGSMADVSGAWPDFGQHTELVMQALASSDDPAAV